MRHLLTRLTFLFTAPIRPTFTRNFRNLPATTHRTQTVPVRTIMSSGILSSFFGSSKAETDSTPRAVQKSDEEWRAVLSPERKTPASSQVIIRDSESGERRGPWGNVDMPGPNNTNPTQNSASSVKKAPSPAVPTLTTDNTRPEYTPALVVMPLSTNRAPSSTPIADGLRFTKEWRGQLRRMRIMLMG